MSETKEDLLIASMESIEPYSGPNSIEGVRFYPVRAALGVTAWGMNLLELDPHAEGYPEHDHSEDGQEEVYFILEGAGLLLVGEQAHEVKKGDFIRVGPALKRKFITKNDGLRFLALGGTPGKAFEPQM